MLDEMLLNDINKRLAPDSIAAVIPIQSVVLVADYTEKYIIKTTRDALFLIISSSVSPLLIKRGADRQRQIKTHLRGFATEAIELPVIEGFLGNKSYAVWPKRQQLSENRICSKLQMLLLAPRVYRWLRAIASQATRPTDHMAFLRNLQRLEGISAMPISIKNWADKAITAVRSGTIVPIQVSTAWRFVDGKSTCSAN